MSAKSIVERFIQNNKNHDTDINDDIIDALIEADMIEQKINSSGYTALHLVSLNGNHRAVLKLLASGANVNVLDDHKVNALHLASVGGHYNVVKTLLGAGSTVGIKNDEGYATYFWASKRGYDDVVKILIEAGASQINKRKR